MNTKVRETSQRCPGPTENIIVLGSEQSYDSFWWKMMFIAPGFGVGQSTLRPPNWLNADRTTVLYVGNGYVWSELLTLDLLRNAGVNVVRIRSTANLIAYLNNRNIDGEEHLILRLVFICHGLPGRLALNYSALPSIEVNTRLFRNISPEAFCGHARLYSYACRTGVWRGAKNFRRLEDAEPENSLAQRMADHLNLPFHAFYRRTLFRHCLRHPDDSESIADAVKEGRKGREGEVINISDEHEALPHPGQGHTLSGQLFGRGEIGEGVSDYTLWRKAGGRALPNAATTPTGLPAIMKRFDPS